MLAGRSLLRAGLVAAAAFWVMEAAIHTWVFDDGAGFVGNLLPADANEWRMRSLAGGLLVALGAYADRAVRAIGRAESARHATQVQLEAYITEHAKSRFSHTLCPTCLPQYGLEP